MSAPAVVRRAVLSAVLLAAPAAAQPAQPTGPLPISPGDLDGIVPAASVCPTFSWTSVDGAEGYEIAVFELLPRQEDRSNGAKPVLGKTLPRGAGSWTPPGDRCLTAGRRYAWSVRSTGPAASDWSESALFVAPGSDTGPVFPGAAALAARPVVPAEQPLAPKVAAQPRLVVDGDVVAAGEYRFDAVRAVRVAVAVEAFNLLRSDEDDPWWVSPGGGFGFVNGGTAPRDVVLQAPVALPDGATITGFTCFYYDDYDAGGGAGNVMLNADLYRREVSSPSGSDLLSSLFAMSSGTSTALLSVADESIDFPLVDNAAYDYRVIAQVGVDSVSQNLRFYGCEVSLDVEYLAAP